MGSSAHSETGAALLTRSFEHAVGTYETVRVRNGKPFHLRKHIERIRYSSEKLKITVPLSREELAASVIGTINTSGLPEAIVYMLIVLHLDGLECTHPKTGERKPFVIITCDPLPPKPERFYTEGMHVTVRHFIRKNPDIKDLSQRGEKGLVRKDALGFDDVLLENDEGFITESTQCNLFLVTDNTLITPAAGMLPGVTREVVIELASGVLPIVQQSITREDLLAADECFLTGTLHNVVPVTKIDGKSVGGGTVGLWTQKIMRAFEQECMV